MKKFLLLLKICLTVVVSSGCESVPEFPNWTPYSVLFKDQKAYDCQLIDKQNLIFRCNSNPTPVSVLPDGMFCTTPEEQVKILNWAREVMKIANDRANSER